MESNTTKQQLLRFLMAGIMAVGTDFTVYWLTSELLAVDVAKGISFICGSVVAFVVNRLWTFEHNAAISSSILHFSTLYSLTFLANVGVNHITLVFIPDIKLLGFLFATATSTILNFFGMKYWVFSKRRHQVSS